MRRSASTMRNRNSNDGRMLLNLVFTLKIRGRSFLYKSSLFTMMVGAICVCEALVTTYKTTKHHNTDHDPDFYCQPKILYNLVMFLTCIVCIFLVYREYEGNTAY
jgi:hypothetical protein